MPSKDVLFLNAAAAGRLVVALLFLANAAAYFVNHTAYSIAGMVLAVGAGACGYFACSASCFADEGCSDGQTIILASILLSILSGVTFLIGA